MPRPRRFFLHVTRRLPEIKKSREHSAVPANEVLEEEKTLNDDQVHYPEVQPGITMKDSPGLEYSVIGKIGWGRDSTSWLIKRKGSCPRHFAMKAYVQAPDSVKPPHELVILRHLQKVANEHHSALGVDRVRHLKGVILKQGATNNVHFSTLHEPCGCSLRQYTPLYDDPQVRSAFLNDAIVDILKGLDFLHTKAKVIHADLTPDNVLVRPFDEGALEIFECEETAEPCRSKELPFHTAYESRQIKTTRQRYKQICIIDFGTTEHSGVETSSRLIGNPLFMAPEALLENEKSYKLDIWSLGVLAWNLFEQRHLFDGLEGPANEQIYTRTRHIAQIESRLGIPPPTTHPVKQASGECLDFRYNGDKQTLHEHRTDQSMQNAERFLNGRSKDSFLDFISRTLAWMPDARPTASELLNDPYLYYVGDVGECRPGTSNDGGIPYN